MNKLLFALISVLLTGLYSRSKSSPAQRHIGAAKHCLPPRAGNNHSG
jgi:hypothetical protein